MAKGSEKTGSKKSDLELISFRLSKELFKTLEEYAETQTDEAGVMLSPSIAARRLMLEGLKRFQQKKS